MEKKNNTMEKIVKVLLSSKVTKTKVLTIQKLMLNRWKLLQ